MSGQPGIVKTPWSDEETAILERVYPTGGSRAVQKLWVRGHAPGQPSGPWLPAEIALLDDCMDQGLSITAIHNRFKKAGFQRALTAIRSRIEQIGLNWHREYWTAADVARALGVTDRASLDWIHDGKLKAKRKRKRKRKRNARFRRFWTPEMEIRRWIGFVNREVRHEQETLAQFDYRVLPQPHQS